MAKGYGFLMISVTFFKEDRTNLHLSSQLLICSNGHFLIGNNCASFMGRKNVSNCYFNIHVYVSEVLYFFVY